MGYWLDRNERKNKSLTPDYEFICEFKCNKCNKCCELHMCFKTDCKCTISERCTCKRLPRIHGPTRFPKTPSMEELLKLAIETNCIRGAGFCIVKENNMTDSHIKDKRVKDATDVMFDLLEPLKNTEYTPMFGGGKESTVVLIYNDDFTDFDDVKKTLGILKDAVKDCVLVNPTFYYKPMLFSSLNIMRGAIPGLKSYIYTDKTIEGISKTDIGRKKYNA